MKFIKKTKNVYQPQQAKTLDGVSIRPGDTVFAFNDDGTPYGVCGAVLATQVDPSRQIEFKGPKQLRGRTQFVAMLDDKAWEE